MNDVQMFRLYARVARLGSFSAAAREAGLAQSQVSRLVAELEANLGARLLSRTTRAVVPTEAGSEFLARIEPILVAIEDAENSVRESGDLRGLLRVAMPTTMGTRVILPRLAAFTEQHPHLQVEVMLEDKMQDMVREAVDVGLRVGPMPDAVGTAREIGSLHRVVVASPAYLQRHGSPARPEELAKHRIIRGPGGFQSLSWRFSRDGETVGVDLQAQVSVNDTEGSLAAAAGGLGMTMATSWASRREMDSGTLVQVLADWKTPVIPVNAYFPLGRATRMAARAFVAFVAEQLATDPPGA